MSDMMFREPNQVKWMGSRPGHNGTQVLLSDTVAAVVPTGFYTVPAGKTLFITSAFLNITNPVAVSYYLAIFNAVPALDQYLINTYYTAGQQIVPVQANYWPPIEVEAGYHLYYRQGVNALLTYTIHGWVE